MKIQDLNRVTTKPEIKKYLWNMTIQPKKKNWKDLEIPETSTKITKKP